MLVHQFSPKPIRLMDIRSRDARHILAARIYCFVSGAGHDPLVRMAECLHSPLTARRFGLLMATVTYMWPDPFEVRRPCCPQAGLDEALLMTAIRLAECNARPQFDEMLGDMLSDDARNTLFIHARWLYSAAASTGQGHIR